MLTPNFKQVLVVNTGNDKTVKADVLERSDKTLKVAIVGTNIVLYLKRTDVKKPYVGNFKNIEFTSEGENV